MLESRSNIPWLKKIILVIGVRGGTVVCDWRFLNLCSLRPSSESSELDCDGCQSISGKQQSFSGLQSPSWSSSIMVMSHCFTFWLTGLCNEHYKDRHYKQDVGHLIHSKLHTMQLPVLLHFVVTCFFSVIADQWTKYCILWELLIISLFFLYALRFFVFMVGFLHPLVH